MNWVSDLLSGFSLVAVIVIGVYSIQLGRRSTVASETSARSSEDAAKVIQRSVNASEKAAWLAAQDALVCRLEAALDTVGKMLFLFREQVLHPETKQTPDLERLALCRELDARTVALETKLEGEQCFVDLAMPNHWTTGNLGSAISKLKDLIKEASLSEDNTQESIAE